VGQSDDLEAVTEFAVCRLTERLFEAVGLTLGELDADHGGASSSGSVEVPPLYTNRTASVGLCMSVSLFEKTPIFEALSLEKPGFDETTGHNQLPLFDL
jgi:hypothetical protein